MDELFENWRSFLDEGMKMPADLPENVFIEIFQDGRDLELQYIEKINGEIHNRPNVWMKTKEGIYGSLQLRADRDCDGAYALREAMAFSGWGPMLYEVAMEIVGRKGITSDRRIVSPEARVVWEKFFRRQDIKKKQANQKCSRNFEPNSPMSFIYWKDNKNMIERLGPKLIGKSNVD